MDQGKAFSLWLHTRGYSASTARNYLVDVRKYLASGLQNPNLYLVSVQTDPNYPRYLASLKKYAEFCQDQGSDLKISPISASSPAPSLESLISLYEKHLVKRGTPIATIRNYLADLNQYVNWLSNPIPTLSLDRAREKTSSTNIAFSPVKGRIKEGF